MSVRPTPTPEEIAARVAVAAPADVAQAHLLDEIVHADTECAFYELAAACAEPASQTAAGPDIAAAFEANLAEPRTARSHHAA